MTFWHSALYSDCFSKIVPLASAFGLLRRKKPAEGYPQACLKWHSWIGLGRFVRWQSILQKLLSPVLEHKRPLVASVHPNWLPGALLSWGSTQCSNSSQELENQEFDQTKHENREFVMPFRWLPWHSVRTAGEPPAQVRFHYSCGMDERLRTSLQASMKRHANNSKNKNNPRKCKGMIWCQVVSSDVRGSLHTSGLKMRPLEAFSLLWLSDTQPSNQEIRMSDLFLKCFNMRGLLCALVLACSIAGQKWEYTAPAAQVCI